VYGQRLITLAWLLLFGACGHSTPPPAHPPDPDGTAAGARALPLDRWRLDQLDCAAGDCADWYRLEVTEPGTLKIELTLEPAQGAAPPIVFRLTDLGEAEIASGHSTGPLASTIEYPATPGHYLLQLATADPKSSTVGYEIHVSLERKATGVIRPIVHGTSRDTQTSRDLPHHTTVPTTPTRSVEPPKHVTVDVLKIEGKEGAVTALLLSGGKDSGLEEGLRGKVSRAGRALGTVQIEKVFPEGIRARVVGTLADRIEPGTVVEFEINPGGRP